MGRMAQMPHFPQEVPHCFCAAGGSHPGVGEDAPPRKGARAGAGGERHGLLSENISSFLVLLQPVKHLFLTKA